MKKKIASADVKDSVVGRYRRLEPHARLFARFKVRLDPLFTELSEQLNFDPPPKALLDIGSGFGVPACWLAESCPTAKIYGIEPDEDRVRVANMALEAGGRSFAVWPRIFRRRRTTSMAPSCWT